MKRSRLIPIEVLRVEDKIFGSLSFLQIGLLACPIFSAIFLLFLPPAGELPIYKLSIVVLVFVIFGSLAYRLHGRLILHWLLLIVRYNLRPKTYVSQVIKQTPKDVENTELLKITKPTPINAGQFVPATSLKVSSQTALKQRHLRNYKRDAL